MANLHVIIGEDDYLVAETAKKLAGGVSGAALEIIDSVSSANAEQQLRDIAEADASYSTPPFLEPVKTTWWKNVGFLPCRGAKAPAQDVLDALLRLARRFAASPLGENQRFVLSGPRLDQRGEFAKLLKSAGAEIAVFAAGKPWERARAAVVRAVDLAAEMNMKFEPGAADAFIARVGADARSVASELGKMRDYLGPGRHTVSIADVDEVASQGVGVEPELWAVTDAIGARDFARASDALARFSQESGFAVLMTTVIEKFFRQLVELKDAKEKGKEGLLAESMSPWAAKKNSGFLRNWSLQELRAARARFMALREKAVSSSASVDALVVKEVAQACRRRGAR